MNDWDGKIFEVEEVGMVMPIPASQVEPLPLPGPPEPYSTLKGMSKRELRRLVRRLHLQASSQAWQMAWMAEHGGVMPSEQDTCAAVWLPIQQRINEIVGRAVDQTVWHV